MGFEKLINIGACTYVTVAIFPFLCLPFAVLRDKGDYVEGEACFMLCLVISVCVQQ